MGNRPYDSPATSAHVGRAFAKDRTLRSRSYGGAAFDGSRLGLSFLLSKLQSWISAPLHRHR